MESERKELRVMSFNIWGNCAKDVTISNRDDLEATVILRYLPEVVGMQECSPKLRAEEININKLLKAEYTEVPAIPTNTNNNNYTPIFYRHSKLSLLDFGWKYYVGLNDKGSKSITWGLFEVKENGKQFLHINTHFYWTGDDKGRAARVTNSGELLALMLELREKYPVPAFFTGDFNCTSAEPPIDVLRKFGLSEVRYTAKEQSPWRSHHVYPKYDAEACKFGEGTCPTHEVERSIDHIFSIGAQDAERFVTVVDSEALDSSDHCPLYADFNI